MDERIRERLHTEEITARTFHSLALYIIQQGSKKRRLSVSWKVTPPRGISYFCAPGVSSVARKSAGQRLASVAGRGDAVGSAGR